MYRIFIVEDNEEQRRELLLFLKQALYETVTPEDDSEILSEIQKTRPDLVLLDIQLPEQNGLELCRKIRQTQEIPVIFLTGRSGPMDELEGMLSGADDYIVKPYCAPVLLARIAAVLKRSRQNHGPSETGFEQAVSGSADDPGNERKDFKIVCHGVTLDLLDGSLAAGGKKTELTRTEQRICYRLFVSGGKIVSREDLLDDLWDDQIFIDDNTLSVNVTRIRKKLQEIGAGELIRTRRGQGYQI